MLNSSKFLQYLVIGSSITAITSSPIDGSENVNKYYSNTYHISRLQNGSINVSDCFSLVMNETKRNEKQGDTMSIELTENLSILHEFLELEDNWDGEGAKHFTKKFIDFLSEIIMDLSVQPDIFPLQDGKVVFEFGNVKKKYLEFSINSEKHMDIYKKNIDGERFKDINVVFTKDRFNQEVNWFES